MKTTKLPTNQNIEAIQTLRELTDRPMNKYSVRGFLVAAFSEKQAHFLAKRKIIQTNPLTPGILNQNFIK